MKLLAYALVTLIGVQTIPIPRPPVGVGGTGGTGGTQGGTGRGGGTTARPPARPMNSKTRSATADALDRYVAGEYERAITQLQRLGGFDTTHAEEWILSGGAPAVQK